MEKEMKKKAGQKPQWIPDEGKNAAKEVPALERLFFPSQSSSQSVKARSTNLSEAVIEEEMWAVKTCINN